LLSHRCHLRLFRVSPQPRAYGDHYVFGLATNPATHVDIAESATGAVSVDVQADPGFAFAAVATASTGDVERCRDQVTHVQEFDVAPLLDDLARDLVTEDHTGWSRGAASYHMRAGLCHSVILLSRAAAHSYCVDNLAISFQRDAAGKDYDATVIGNVNFRHRQTPTIPSPVEFLVGHHYPPIFSSLVESSECSFPCEPRYRRLPRVRPCGPPITSGTSSPSAVARSI
jgi:hypothetical protein